MGTATLLSRPWSLCLLLSALLISVLWLPPTSASTHCPSSAGRVVTKDQRTTAGDAERDNSGSIFYLTFLENNGENPPSYYTIFITTTETTSVLFTVEAPGIGFSADGETTFGVVANVTIPTSLTQSSTPSYQRGIIVRSNNGESLIVYCLNEELFSTDAFLALPYISDSSITLGQQHTDGLFTYVFVAYDYAGVGPSLAGIVAHENGTDITVYPKSTAFGLIKHKANILFTTGLVTTLTLNRGETVYIRTDDDITGSVVKSTSPITLLTGMQCTQVPQGIKKCDHIVEQIPPVSTWGSRFVTVPLQRRKAYDIFRFIAGRNCTSVTVNCVNGTSHELSTPIEFQLNEAEFHEINISSALYCLVSSSDRILAVQYSIGTEADNISADPFMAILPSTDRASHQYTFITPGSSVQKYDHFINIVIPATFYQPDQITIDGQPLLSLTNDIVPIAIDGPTAFYAARVELDDGSHTLSHSNVLAQMGLLVYGYGIQNSYGYPGAYALQALEIDPFNFFVVEATARCLQLLWERPIGSTGAMTYTVTVENAASYRREYSTEETNLEVCDLKDLTEYTVSLNATSSGTVTDTAVVAQVVTAALLLKVSAVNVSYESAKALCTFSPGLQFATLRCLVVCVPTPRSSISHGQRSSISGSLQNGTTETIAPLTELETDTQYACEAVAISSGIWSVEQHQVSAVLRTLKRSGNVVSGSGNELVCSVGLGVPLGVVLALLIAVILLLILIVVYVMYKAKRKGKMKAASVSPTVASYQVLTDGKLQLDCKPSSLNSTPEKLHRHVDNYSSSSSLPPVSS